MCMVHFNLRHFTVFNSEPFSNVAINWCLDYQIMDTMPKSDLNSVSTNKMFRFLFIVGILHTNISFTLIIDCAQVERWF